MSLTFYYEDPEFSCTVFRNGNWELFKGADSVAVHMPKPVPSGDETEGLVHQEMRAIADRQLAVYLADGQEGTAAP